MTQHGSIRSLYLRDFRNYKEAEVSFSPECNLIRGNNAQGKTNLLEAIYLLTVGRSFRTQHLSDLIRENQSLFYLEAHIIQNGVNQKISLSFDGKTKRLQCNANTYSSFSPLLGTLPLILHTPGDIDLIEGLPALRRRLINLHLAQRDPLYVHHLTRFWRAMKQRNALLRAATTEDSITCWELEMAKSAQYLWEMRQHLVEHLREPIALHGKYLSGGDELHELRYHPSRSQNYPEHLQKNRKRDRELKMTLIGPHRDDFSFWIDGKPAKTFASEGQKKTAIACLRLAEWDCLSYHFDSPAMLAIDDLGLPLDTPRQIRLHEKLKDLGQVFMTTPDTAPNLPCHTIEVIQGSFTSKTNIYRS